MTQVPSMSDLYALEERVLQLETFFKAINPPERNDEVLTKEQACEYTRLTIHGLNEARRAGRIKGMLLNRKEYGYKRSDLDKYLKRYE